MLVIAKSSQQLLSMVSCSFHHDQNKRVSIIVLTINSLIDLNNFHSETCFIPDQSNHVSALCEHSITVSKTSLINHSPLDLKTEVLK